MRPKAGPECADNPESILPFGSTRVVPTHRVEETSV